MHELPRNHVLGEIHERQQITLQSDKTNHSLQWQGATRKWKFHSSWQELLPQSTKNTNNLSYPSHITKRQENQWCSNWGRKLSRKIRHSCGSWGLASFSFWAEGWGKGPAPVGRPAVPPPYPYHQSMQTPCAHALVPGEPPGCGVPHSNSKACCKSTQSEMSSDLNPQFKVACKLKCHMLMFFLWFQRITACLGSFEQNIPGGKSSNLPCTTVEGSSGFTFLPARFCVCGGKLNLGLLPQKNQNPPCPNPRPAAEVFVQKESSKNNTKGTPCRAFSHLLFKTVFWRNRQKHL